MRPFNLEEAKKGKPVVNSEGYPVKIISFDRKHLHYPIVGLVEKNGVEHLESYTIDGKIIYDTICCHLFMATRKVYAKLNREIKVSYSKLCNRILGTIISNQPGIGESFEVTVHLPRRDLDIELAKTGNSVIYKSPYMNKGVNARIVCYDRVCGKYNIAFLYLTTDGTEFVEFCDEKGYNSSGLQVLFLDSVSFNITIFKNWISRYLEKPLEDNTYISWEE